MPLKNTAKNLTQKFQNLKYLSQLHGSKFGGRVKHSCLAPKHANVFCYHVCTQDPAQVETNGHDKNNKD